MTPKDTIIQACELLFSPGQVVEVRAFRKRGVSSGYFTDFAKLAEKSLILDGDSEYSGIYVTLNEVNPDLFARRANRIEMRLSDKDRTTCDDDIIRRRWFPIDIDPHRLSGISSSDEEHQIAFNKAEQVQQFLSENGWPEPIRANSGNGAHLLYPVDLPNDQSTLTLFKDALQVLSTFFSDDDASIDLSVSNASRIWKLYGTIARKGDSTPKRPHRRSSLLSVPDEKILVTKAHLAALAALLCEQPSEPLEQTGKIEKRKSSVSDLGTWLSGHGLSYKEKPFHGGTIFLFDECPFSSAHKDGAYAIQFQSGGIFAGCHHNSCGGGSQRWPELRERYDGPGVKPDYETRIKQGIRKRAKAKVERDGYRFEPTEPAHPTRPDSEDTAIIVREGEGNPSLSVPDDSDFDPRKEALSILHSGDPLKYSLQTFALDHEGDTVVATCMALSLASRAIANPKSKGLHISVTGISGKGKSNAFDTMLSQVPDAYLVGERISDKALFYDENLIPGMVITLDDTSMSDQMQEILKGVTSSFQKPFRYKTVNKDRKGQICVIPERCVWWIAKVEGTGDDQVYNRMLTIWIDDSEEQDQKVLTRTLVSASEFPAIESISHPEILVCKEMWEILFTPVWVVIPYAQDIRFTSASNRRNSDMLIDLIRSHAILKQFQRKREERSGIICVTATMEDFSQACSLYSQLCGECGGQTTKMTRRETDLITAIRDLELNEFTLAQLQRITNLPYGTLYQIIHGYTSRGVSYSGILQKCPALSYTDRTVSDENEGKAVKRRSKAYLWDNLLYECWSKGGKCWISHPNANIDSDDDLGNDTGDDEGSVLHVQQQYNMCCTKTENESSLLTENNHNNAEYKNQYNNQGDRATADPLSEHKEDHICESQFVVRTDPISANIDSYENLNEYSTGLEVQPLHETAVLAVLTPESSNSALHTLKGSDINAELCTRSYDESGYYSGKDREIPLTNASQDRRVRDEVESIRTLPGILDIRRMKRTTTDYGRCTVCNLQGITWWDEETKTGICETCYERETLLGKGALL